MTHCVDQHQKKFDCEVRWPAGNQGKAGVPQLLQQFEQLPGVIELEWKTAGTVTN
jgi:hypothetical protein